MQAISEAFATWSAINEQFPGIDETSFRHLAEEQARIEDLAVQLPICTALDVFQLIATTVNATNARNIAAEILFHRARDEVTRT
jgi:hypothetical protein